MSGGSRSPASELLPSVISFSLAMRSSAMVAALTGATFLASQEMPSGASPAITGKMVRFNSSTRSWTSRPFQSCRLSWIWTERADGVHQHVRGPDFVGDPADEPRRLGGVGGVGHLAPDFLGEATQRVLGPVDRHDRKTVGGEGDRCRVTKRTASTSHDRHRCAHGVTRPKSAAASRSRLFRIVNYSFSSHRCSE
jgi:hypothetical protein